MAATPASQTLRINAAKVQQTNIVQHVSGSKALTDGSATSFVDIALAAGEMVGGKINYCIYVTNGTDYQVHPGIVTFAAADKAGTLSSDIDEVYLAANETEVKTSGTLTDAFSIVDGANKISIALNASTSLAGATLTLKYTVSLYSENTITAL